jgi:alanine dehydrogenase
VARVIVGIPREVKEDEYRVAITPAGVRELVAAGHTVHVEHDAGAGSALPDAEFVATGARILDDPDDVWAGSDLVLKVKEPVPEEYPRLAARRGQVLFTYLHLAASRPCTEALVAAGNTAIAYETVRLADGSLPLLTPMSEVAGRMAPLVGAHHLARTEGGRGTLICGVPGVESARVVILGAGVAGMAAATLAVGMHADVHVLDTNLDRLRQVDHHFRGALQTVASSTHAIEEACLEADLVIGAVLVVGARAPELVTDELVASMRPGSVLVDISVDQGGCFEPTRPTTHSHPTFAVHRSTFYCVANMPGAYPHTSTHALVNATLPYSRAIAGRGWREAARSDPALAEGVNVAQGAVVYEPVARAHGLRAAPLAGLL